MIMIYIGTNDKLKKFLTYGKEYYAEIEGNYCIVWNNADQSRRYKIEYFITKQEYRNRKIDELLNEL